MSEMFKGYEDGLLPFMPGAGAINGRSVEEITENILDVARSPAAAVKFGSLTYNGGLGNTGRTYHHNSITGITDNSMGLPNIDFKEALKLQKLLQPQVEAKGKPLIPSLSPGTGETAAEVLPEMAYAYAEAGVPVIEINYSCPNKLVDGGMAVEPVFGYDLDAMFETDERIVERVGTEIIIIRKLPPPALNKKDLLIPTAAFFARQRGRVALGLFNTIPGQSVLNEYGEPALAVGENGINVGGLSGRAFAPMSIRGLKQAKKILPDSVGVISSIGVDRAEQIFERVDILGSSSTEGVTFLWENQKRGIKFGRTIAAMAEKYQELRDAA